VFSHRAARVTFAPPVTDSGYEPLGFVVQYSPSPSFPSDATREVVVPAPPPTAGVTSLVEVTLSPLEVDVEVRAGRCNAVHGFPLSRVRVCTCLCVVGPSGLRDEEDGARVFVTARQDLTPPPFFSPTPSTYVCRPRVAHSFPRHVPACVGPGCAVAVACAGHRFV
jgi:hypothetical protein